MYIVIDADIFSFIVNNHIEFTPIIKCIVDGSGRLVYGGTKYETELNNHLAFKRFLVELKRARRVVEIDKARVDYVEDILKLHFSGNDQHIVSIVIVQKCDVVCTLDDGLCSLIDKCYCAQGRIVISQNCNNIGRLKRPKIYKDSTHVGVLRN